MTQHFFLLEGWLLLLFTLGSFADEYVDKWAFTFPQVITTRKHSDVEIPCTFTAPADYGEFQIVWFKYNKFQYPKVYSENSSEVLPEYRDRTSLIRNGTNSCSLKIKDVGYTASYYPGISEKINSYDLNKEGKIVRVKVLGCTEDASCNDWDFSFPRSIDVLKDSCVEIPCRLTYPNDTPTFGLFWYQNKLIGYPKIFNSRNPTDVEKKYKGRTSLVGNSADDCSLRINNVRESVEIYPGINENINSYHINIERFCRLTIIEAPPQPLINTSDHMREGELVNIACSVTHTCASSPPSITWNKTDLDVTMSHENLDRGVWRIKSTIRYIPSYRDDKTQLICTVTFPNGKITERSVTLDIKSDKQGNSKNIWIIGGAVGFLATAIIALIVIFCILKRRCRTSAQAKEKRSRESDKVTEKIMMENVLYGNLNDVPEQDSARTRNQLFGNNNNGEEERSSHQDKAKITEDSIVYCSVKLSPASHNPRNTEEKEYAQLNI